MYRVDLLIGYFLSLSMILFICACIPYHKLSQKEFPQGKDLQTYYNISEEFLKSQVVYDQFTTLASFNVLWLSDETRIAYVNMYCQKHGKSQNTKEALLKRQLEENRHWISFYVLADIRDQFNETMTEKDASWTPYLEIDGQRLEPEEEIKEIELEPEYVTLFSGKINPFKVSYLVKFPARNLLGRFYLDDCKVLKLVISSVEKACELEWELSKKPEDKEKDKRVKKNEDFYWG